MNGMRRSVLLGLLGALLLAGCATLEAQRPPARRPLPPAPAEPLPPDPSSLWSERSPFFFIDRRAHRVGDIITIKVSEVSSAKKEADTDMEKSTSLSAALGRLLGYERALSSKNKRFSPDNALSATLSNNFDADTETSRTDTLSATLSAVVVEVLPNGNLALEGRRSVKVNEEDQIITISGVIRPEDIASDNTVESKFIADASITYTGVGILAEKQKPGWLSRAIDLIWPF